MSFFKEKLTKIKAFVFDVDGVLSRETQLLSSDGETIRSSNLKDGFAMMTAIRRGYHIAVITGGRTIEVINRCKKTGIKDIYTGTLDKLPCFIDFMQRNNLKKDEVVYMGDDLPDYPPMMNAGIAVCPKDAAPEIKAIASYISDRKGGEGCARDIIEQVMRAQNTWIIPEKMDWSKF